MEDLPQAYTHVFMALQWRERRYGPEHKLTINAAANLGCVPLLTPDVAWLHPHDLDCVWARQLYLLQGKYTECLALATRCMSVAVASQAEVCTTSRGPQAREL